VCVRGRERESVRVCVSECVCVVTVMMSAEAWTLESPQIRLSNKDNLAMFSISLF